MTNNNFTKRKPAFKFDRPIETNKNSACITAICDFEFDEYIEVYPQQQTSTVRKSGDKTDVHSNVTKVNPDLETSLLNKSKYKNEQNSTKTKKLIKGKQELTSSHLPESSGTSLPKKAQSTKKNDVAVQCRIKEDIFQDDTVEDQHPCQTGLYEQNFLERELNAHDSQNLSAEMLAELITNTMKTFFHEKAHVYTTDKSWKIKCERTDKQKKSKQFLQQDGTDPKRCEETSAEQNESNGSFLEDFGPEKLAERIEITLFEFLEFKKFSESFLTSNREQPQTMQERNTHNEENLPTDKKAAEKTDHIRKYSKLEQVPENKERTSSEFFSVAEAFGSSSTHSAPNDKKKANSPEHGEDITKNTKTDTKRTRIKNIFEFLYFKRKKSKK